MKNRKLSLKSLGIFAIRLFFFLCFPALFSTAFTGIKKITESIAQQQMLEWNAFVSTLVLLCVLTILLGRKFCGYLCAFGSYGDFIYFLSSKWRKKRKKRPLCFFQKWERNLFSIKYILLFLILTACILGYGSQIDAWSPCNAFSRLHSLHLPQSIVAGLLFLGITIGMAVEPRFFCKYLCPMGAIFALLPVLPFSIVKRRREECIPGCKGCKLACPAHLDVPFAEDGDASTSGECFSCGKCKPCKKKMRLKNH